MKYFHIATDEDDIDNSERKAKEEEEEKKAEEKRKKDEIALKGKLEKELLDYINDDVDKFEKVLSSMNKGFKTEYKGFNEFTSTQLEQYLKAKIRGNK